MTLLYLVRHGETDWNRQHRIQGSTDIPLNDLGRKQALRTARLLSRQSWDGIYSSPLQRACETAAIIGAELGLGAPQTLATLVERHYGVAEGLTDRELDRKYPSNAPIPGRETREAVAARVMSTLLALAETSPGGRLIVATHGAVIRTVLLSVKAPIHRGMPITNGSVHSFRHVGGELELVEFDDPIEVESVSAGDEGIDEQNPIEEREGTEAK